MVNMLDGVEERKGQFGKGKTAINLWGMRRSHSFIPEVSGGLVLIGFGPGLLKLGKNLGAQG